MYRYFIQGKLDLKLEKRFIEKDTNNKYNKTTKLNYIIYRYGGL